MTRIMGGLRTYQLELPHADTVRDRAMSVYARSRRTESVDMARTGHQKKSWAEVSQPGPESTARETEAPFQSATYASMGGTHVPESMSNTPVSAPTHEQIAQRAYEIYLERGQTPGDPDQDWLRAERELREAARR